MVTWKKTSKRAGGLQSTFLFMNCLYAVYQDIRVFFWMRDIGVIMQVWSLKNGHSITHVHIIVLKTVEWVHDQVKNTAIHVVECCIQYCCYKVIIKHFYCYWLLWTWKHVLRFYKHVRLLPFFRTLPARRLHPSAGVSAACSCRASGVSWGEEPARR